VGRWIDWNIDLQDFASVNLANVESISIGFGPRGSEIGTPGVEGVVYFDDIALYPTRCVPKYAPAGDISDDCVVDFKDVEILGNNWLEDRR